MNKVILMGRLTRDPEVRWQNSGDTQLAIARYTLAVDRRTRQEESQCDFIRCVVFGKGAEFAEKYLHQGTKIVVEGRIQTGSYQNKDGQTVYTTDVVVENQEFAESKAASQQVATQMPQAQTQQTPPQPQPQQAPEQFQPQQAPPQPQQAPVQTPTQQAPPANDGFMPIPETPDGGLPFNF